MAHAIGFDIYGTLVNPLEMDRHLEPVVARQVEYAFRRGLMREYRDFGVCTRQALEFAARSLGVELSEEEREHLIAEYQNLHPFPDVLPGLEKMKSDGHEMVAFSNGVEQTARTLLERAGVIQHLDGVVSVDDVATFKPDPEVYAYLARRLNLPAEEVWLVSSNAWDVIGAKSFGLRAAWLQRDPEAVFDPWGLEPDLVAGDLLELSEKLA
jgi:2-haloacid dehalogenase